MGNAVQAYGVAEGRNDMFLTDKVVQSLGAISPSDDLVRGRARRDISLLCRVAHAPPRLLVQPPDRGEGPFTVLNICEAGR